MLHLNHLKSIACVFCTVDSKALQLTNCSSCGLDELNEWNGDVVPSFWVDLRDCFLLRDAFGVFAAKSSGERLLSLQELFQRGIQVLVRLLKFLF